MKYVLIVFVILANSSFAATGNQASISDIKEAVYKLIILNEKNRSRSAKVVYKPLRTQKSYLDKYIRSYVLKNRKLLPAK